MTYRATLSERLLARLRDTEVAEYLPEGARLVRANASRSARANGAWVWRSEGPSDTLVGSQWSMTSLMAAPGLFLDPPDRGAPEWTVYPDYPES